MLFLLRSAAWLIVLSAIGYFAVFVPLGSRTLWEHITRIASTEEAQELGREVDSASQRIETALEGELRERLLQPSRDSDTPAGSGEAVLPPEAETVERGPEESPSDSP